MAGNTCFLSSATSILPAPEALIQLPFCSPAGRHCAQPNHPFGFSYPPGAPVSSGSSHPSGSGFWVSQSLVWSAHSLSAKEETRPAGLSVGCPLHLPKDCVAFELGVFVPFQSPLAYWDLSQPHFAINFSRPETPQESLISGCLDADWAPPVPGILAKSWRAG